MSQLITPLVIIVDGVSEFPEDSGVGTYWSSTRLELGHARGPSNAIAFVEAYAQQPRDRDRDDLAAFCPQSFTILDGDGHLVLGGQVYGHEIRCAAPATTDEEAVTLERLAKEVNSKGSFEHGWDNYSTADQLWRRAELIAARLVDPQWRSLSIQALANYPKVAFS
jgi:hypothetical protein